MPEKILFYMQRARENLKRNICLLVVFVIFTFYAVNNYFILVNDNIPVLYDELNYFVESNKLYRMLCDVMAKGEVPKAFDILRHWNSPYPQLVQLTTALFYCIFGVSEDAAVLSILPYLLILFLSVYFIGSKLYGNAVGLFATFLVSVFPMVFGMSRVYYLEVPVTAMVSVTLLFLLYSDYFLNRRYSILYGVFLALALLVKWISLIFIMGPLAYYIFIVGCSKGRTKELKKRAVANLFISLLIAVVLIFPMYALIIKTFLDRYGSIFINLSREKTYNFNAYALTKYVRYLFEYNLLPLFSWLFLISLPFFCFCVRKGRLLLISWIFLPYLFFTALVICGYPEDARFAVPYLPASALMISAVIFSIKHFKYRFIDTILSLFIVVIALFGIVQFLRLSYSQKLKSVLSSRIITGLDHGAGRYWPKIEDWKGEEVLATILKQKPHLNAAGFKVMPLYNLDIIDSPIKRELCLSNKWNIEYDYLLAGAAGGYLCVENRNFCEDKIKSADMIIIKDGGFLGVSDERTCAPKMHKILIEMFEKHKDKFYLLDTLDLPDKSHLLVYQKM